MSTIDKSRITHFIKKFNKPEPDSQLVREVKKFWNQLTPGEKVFAPLCALNLIVFGLWKVPRLQGGMMQYFCSNPASRVVCWPMVLSTFSHYSAFHIFANMYVLHSFSNAAVMSLGKEQFLGLYLAAGVISSFSSYMLKAMTKTAGLSLGAVSLLFITFLVLQHSIPVRRDNDNFGLCLHKTPRHTAWNPLPTNVDVFSRYCHQSHHGNRLGWMYFGMEVLRPRRSFGRSFVWCVLGILWKGHLATQGRYPEILPYKHQVRYKEIVFDGCYCCCWTNFK